MLAGLLVMLPAGHESPLLVLRGLCKSFGGTAALKDVCIEIQPGEVVGLIGENGAGKSTLIKILSGVHRPDEGTILWQGRELHLSNPHQALKMGIATIHQELAYFEKLTVAENLFMGERWPRHPWGGTNWGKLFSQARELLEGFELPIAPDAFFYTLSPAQRQEVAIARALSHDAKLLILDEPTASLTEPEVNRLMAHLERLRESGVTLIYVSHRLNEVLTLTDRVMVLRDGRLVDTFNTSQASIPLMVKEMVGRSLDLLQPRQKRHRPGPVLLQLKGLTRNGLFDQVNLQVHAGEVVGLAGLVGAGRSELARCIFGMYPQEEGEMRFGTKDWRPANPDKAVRGGVVYIPEERKRQGFVLEHSVAEGISAGFLRLISRFGLISKPLETSKVQEATNRFGIRARSPQQAVGTLSGGNQQKALLARWLEGDPKLIILDEPTRGVDVGAKAEIHRLIDQLAVQGKGILLISSDLPEVLALSDRVVVLHQGKVAAELGQGEMTQENVLLAASGLANDIRKHS